MAKNRREFIKLSAAGSLAVLTGSACASSEDEEGINNVSANEETKVTKPLVVSTWNHGIAANADAWKILETKGSALDAVEQGVNVTESDPDNGSVGLGGRPDRDGKVTLDACIMNEKNQCGSVAFLQHIENPISVARKVMETTPHVMLVGAGNFEEFVKVYPKYHDNIIELSEGITASYNLPFSMDELIHKLDLPTLMTELLNSSISLVSTIFIVLIYMIFIILEERVFPQKLKMIFKSDVKYKGFMKTMQKIDESIRTYLSIKTGLCFLSAIISYIILICIGVDFAVLWAFLIFLLTFIPIIGAFVGVLFPTIIAFIEFGGYFEALLVLTLLSTAQLIIGNFIEPKVLGNKLNLSPLSVIIALSFWGGLWGVAGMFLCVPITVILMIIFAQFPTTRPIAILLSGGKGFSDPDDPE
ncbi:AI-2E family transporter [Crocinitomix catalasitica]|nr:AI-2E family transporter [Crocinitomix catalasitica]